jgi:hypothetical protein
MQNIKIKNNPYCKLLHSAIESIFEEIPDNEFDSIGKVSIFDANFVNIKFTIDITYHIPQFASKQNMIINSAIVKSYGINFLNQIYIQPKQSIQYLNLDFKIVNESSNFIINDDDLTV